MHIHRWALKADYPGQVDSWTCRFLGYLSPGKAFSFLFIFFECRQKVGKSTVPYTLYTRALHTGGWVGHNKLFRNANKPLLSWHKQLQSDNNLVVAFSLVYLRSTINHLGRGPRPKCSTRLTAIICFAVNNTNVKHLFRKSKNVRKTIHHASPDD